MILVYITEYQSHLLTLRKGKRGMNKEQNEQRAPTYLHKHSQSNYMILDLDVLHYMCIYIHTYIHTPTHTYTLHTHTQEK